MTNQEAVDLAMAVWPYWPVLLVLAVLGGTAIFADWFVNYTDTEGDE